jgi:flagellar assembly factor FliW
MRKGHLTLVIAIALLAIVIVTCTASNQTTNTAALAQTIAADATPTPTSTFDMNGAISSLVLGMPPNSKTVDMTAVQKFILSGDWSIDVNQGKLTNFKGNFYTGPVNGGTSNHTHQLSNFRISSSNNSSIQLTPDKSVSISGIVDVGTNGKKAWNDVNATVVISKGRTIAISLADEDTQSHFMGQQIYGIVKKINI